MSCVIQRTVYIRIKVSMMFQIHISVVWVMGLCSLVGECLHLISKYSIKIGQYVLSKFW
jgi:hypothetical protein